MHIFSLDSDMVRFFLPEKAILLYYTNNILDSHSDSTHSLQRVHLEKVFKSVAMKKKNSSTSLEGLRVSIFSAKFSFLVYKCV